MGTNKYVRKMTEEDDREFMRDFPTTDNKTLAERYGICVSYVTMKARLMGIKKDPDWLYRKQVAAALKAHNCRTDETRRKMSETKKRIYRSERRRVIMGLPQKTHMVVSFITRSKQIYIDRMRHLGYIRMEGNEHRGILYYDGNTQRGRIAERHAARHFIKILPLPEDIKQIV